MLIDTHAHLDAPDFDDDRAEVLDRARAAGVREIVLAGAARTIEDLERTVLMAEVAPWLWATAGVHPHEARFYDSALAARIDELCANPNVVAVGETGLDFHYNHSPAADQARAFAHQIEIARSHGLPVVCHVRDAHAEAREVLADTSASDVGGIIHCFTGTPDDARAYVDLGFHISFSGIVTFRGARSEPIREAAARVPADRILIETDSPYLAPEPMRGKRNESAYLVHTAARVAALRGISAAELAALTSANARLLLGLPSLEDSNS